jgi:metal-responsive CopG/Arc/MetJ family transcriptional regulator
MGKDMHISLYIQKDLVEELEQYLKQTNLKSGTYINKLIRKDLNQKGAHERKELVGLGVNPEETERKNELRRDEAKCIE